MIWADAGTFYQKQWRKADDPAKLFEYIPNLDQLAQDGTRLTNHYCAAPVCALSRAYLMLEISHGHANV